MDNLPNHGQLDWQLPKSNCSQHVNQKIWYPKERSGCVQFEKQQELDQFCTQQNVRRLCPFVYLSYSLVIHIVGPHMWQPNLVALSHKIWNTIIKKKVYNTMSTFFNITYFRINRKILLIIFLQSNGHYFIFYSRSI